MLRNFCILSLLLFTNVLFAQSEFRVIVKYNLNKEILNQEEFYKNTLKNFKTTLVNKIEPMAGNAYVLTLKNLNSNQNEFNRKITIDKILKRLRMEPNIKYAVEDRVSYFKPFKESNGIKFFKTPSHNLQWNEFSPPGGIMLESKPGLRDGAWQHTTGFMQNPVVIAVLDTGVALHTSLNNNLVKDEHNKVWGWNFSANNRNLEDETNSYHGTHVSGIIAGYGETVLGVGENLKILTLKIPDSYGMFYESSVINAMYWSVGGEVPGIPQNPFPAKVLNMSFGVDISPGRELDSCDEALQEAVEFVRSKNALLVAAAGNDNKGSGFNAPAACNGVLKIAATGPEGLRSYYSNYGKDISFAAPGGDLRYGKDGAILSTVHPYGGYYNSGFDFYQGTSMASPHVAGVAGLVIAQSNDSLSVVQVEQILTLTSHQFGQSQNVNYSCVGKKSCGHGIVDANLAVLAAKENFDIYLKAPVKTDGYSAANIYPWKKIKKLKGKITRPYVEVKKGHIYAYSNDIKFKLIENEFSACKVIGFNGIGCHK